VASAELQSI